MKKFFIPFATIALMFSLQNCKKQTGCTDYTAKNFNPAAVVDDESCIYYTYGCTDRNALNYDAHAEFDDGKCQYPEGYVLGTFGTGKKAN